MKKVKLINVLDFTCLIATCKLGAGAKCVHWQNQHNQTSMGYVRVYALAGLKIKKKIKYKGSAPPNKVFITLLLFIFPHKI